MKWPSLILVSIIIVGLGLMRQETKKRLSYQINFAISDDGSWEYDFVTGVGNDKPSYEILNVVKAWNKAEGGNKTAKFNPLNTTQPMPGDSCFNQLNGKCGVRNYASYEDGLEANITTVTNGKYSRILEGLRSNDVDLVINGIGEGVWGTDADTVSQVYATLPVPVRAQSRPMLQGSDRQRIVAYALSIQGQPYVVGGGRAAYRSGQLGSGSGDCSSTMEHIYNQILGIEIGTSTFTQFTNGFMRGGVYGNPNTVPISASQLQPGDLWYGVYPSDEHTGMVVGDVTGDGTMDLIDQGGKKSYFGVNNDFLNDPYFMDNTIGYSRILP